LARALRRGTRLGKYRLERRIDRGASAEVWKARDMVEGRVVALKVIHPDAVEEWGRSDIEKEARIVSRLDHPNIVPVRNSDWADGRFIIASDLAVANLANYPRARRSGAVALRIIRDVAAGLAYAHEKRLIHRDVKPENIMIYADGHAALGDFGASRFSKGATRVFTDAGTLGYMAPEQAYGRVRFASDVFSLGLIAYEVITGVLPTWPFEWPPERFDLFESKVPEPVRTVLRRAARFDPKRRYKDAVEMRHALEHAFASVERPKPSKPPRRRLQPADRSPLEVHAEAFRRVHGKALGLRYGCHRCGGPIAEAMGHCPWCGAGDNSFGEITSASLVCPDCERGVRPEWNACPWCYSGRFVSNGRKPPRDPHAVRTCPTRGCEGQLRPFMRYCPMCKQKPRRVWSHDHLPDRCPRCRWPTSHAFLRFCPWCGRREPRAGAFRARRR
jgi:tRNA A-37 threonylcarbamoyl transferase component Bud32